MATVLEAPVKSNLAPLEHLIVSLECGQPPIASAALQDNIVLAQAMRSQQMVAILDITALEEHQLLNNIKHRWDIML